jgi:uncharacterized protein YoaH (UPF0181 family)
VGTYHDHFLFSQAALTHFLHRLVQVLEEFCPFWREISRRQSTVRVESQVRHVLGIGGARDHHGPRSALALLALLLLDTLAAAALLLVLYVTRVRSELLQTAKRSTTRLTGAEYAGELVANRIEGVLDRGRCSAQYIALAAQEVRARRESNADVTYSFLCFSSLSVGLFLADTEGE